MGARPRALFPRLFATLAPGGVLAVQMPDNLGAPSHESMREVASLPAYAATIGDAGSVRSRVLAPEGYYDLLARDAAQRRRLAHHVPPSDGLAMRPSSTGCAAPASGLSWIAWTQRSSAAFLADYERRIDAAYPARSDGQRLLSFPRLFIVATRRA